ncbi:uncharacterized protein KQ657_004387 [Scheffersomyces spartinae]|uniref:Uncharacterized protein n=1 Tax=Scheffersomyces spartinae TaxID=45513 RepID=A0A9P7VBJ8_9ASCO|nr:uncharacterized protein KQ657_004387 [Scheffersomyces spartinae]KAG7194710.1 hypothetical protein KQ657_004387 [Scheffersomyces spartinae]
MSVDFQTLISPCDSNTTMTSFTDSPFEPTDVEQLLQTRTNWLVENPQRFDQNDRESINTVATSAPSSLMATETRSSRSSSRTESEAAGIESIDMIRILYNETSILIPLEDVSKWALELGYPGYPLTITHVLCYLKFVKNLPYALNQLQLLHMGKLYRYNDVNILLESINLRFPMNLRLKVDLPPIAISPQACLPNDNLKKLLWIGRIKTIIRL